MKNLLKTNYLYIFIFIFIIIASVILCRPLNDLDEVWNYSFAKNIADGLVPYRDFNLVTTPLLPFICGLFLTIFGNELIIMRLLAIFLITFIFFISYCILKKLNINKYYIFITLFLLFLLLKNYICIDYNFAILAITLLLIYMQINENKSYFLIGFLSGLCILFKQSTGLAIAFITVFYPILFIKNKIDFKNYIKISLIKILGISVPVILLIIYLIFNNALYDFIDYTILGIKTFTNSISYVNLIKSNNIPIKLLSIFMPIFLLILGFIKKEKKLLMFWLYSIASLVVIFPISDNIHFLIGFTPTIILFSYSLYILIRKVLVILQTKFNFNIFFKEFIKTSISLFLIFYLISSIYQIGINIPKNHNIKHYTGISISDNLLNKINTIDEYISNEKNPVYILDAEASIYMIPIDRYYKDFNLFNKGNLGSKGEDGQIEKINKLNSGDKILIKNDNYKRNWQSPEKVISYIKNNLNKIGEISIFDIYEVR